MPDIFLSYSREDQATARHFAEGLQREGFSVWWDQTLGAGDAYDEVTEKALDEARAVVVLWSKTSVASRWVRAEATTADRNGTLVPAMIEPCRRPIMFELTHTAELAHWKGEPGDPAWQSFMGDLRKFVGRAGAPAATAPAGQSTPEPRSGRPVLAIAAVAALLAIGAGSLWWFNRGETPSGAVPVIAAKPAEVVMLAVLPFKDISPDHNQRDFVDGLSLEIHNTLGRLGGLTVIGRTSSDVYKDKDVDLRLVGKDLGVAYIVEGEVRREGNQLRVSVRLNDAVTGAGRWVETYQRPFTDIWAIQEDIARNVANALQIKLGVGDIGRQPGMTRNIDAYTAYLEGTANADLNPEALRREFVRLEAATHLDPSFAQAWADLYNVYSFAQSAGLPGATREEWARKADAAFANLRRLAPEHPYASLRPTDNPIYLMAMGRYRDALPLWEQVRITDPKQPLASTMLVAAYIGLEQPAAASAELARGQQFAADKTMVRDAAVQLALASGDRAALRRVIAASGSDLDRKLQPLLDKPQQALAVLRDVRSPELLLQAAEWMAWFGEHAEALQLLRSHVGEVNAMRRLPLWTLWHPALHEMRRLAGFKDLVRQLTLRNTDEEIPLLEAWHRYGWGEFCQLVGANDFECR